MLDDPKIVINLAKVEKSTVSVLAFILHCYHSVEDELWSKIPSYLICIS